MSFFDPIPAPTPYTPGPPKPPAPPPAPTDFYSKLLANDPTLQSTLNALATLGDSYKTGFGTNIAQLLEQYGAVPDDVPEGLKPYITQTVRDLAGQATAGGVSMLAQLAKAARIAHAGSINSLAARGIIHSGALGQHENEDLQNANVARAQALSDLLGRIGGAQQTYLGQQQSLESQREGAANDALGRIYQQIQGGLISAPGGSATTTGGTTTTPKVPAAPRFTYNPRVTANRTGASARRLGGIYAIH